MRDYNYRQDKQELFVKRRIINIIYAREYYNNGYRIYWRNGFNFSERDPEDKWFNYLGEYTRVYRKSRAHGERRWKTEWGDEWKPRYSSNRARLKKITKMRINDQIGKTYYIFDK